MPETPKGIERIAAKDARIHQLEVRLEAMRESGDGLWYVLRHAHSVTADDLLKAMEDWQEARNNA